MNKFKMGDNIDGSIERNIGVVEKVLVGTTWKWEQWRDGCLIDQWIEKNLCTNEGLNYMIDAAFSAATAITDWYVAVFNNNYTPASNSTYATPGFTESTHYDEATRPAWTEAGASAKQITNTASKASFTMSTSETIYGAALVGGGTAATTKGDAAGGGVVFCVSQFSSGSKAVVDNDVLKVTVTLTAADA